MENDTWLAQLREHDLSPHMLRRGEPVLEAPMNDGRPFLMRPVLPTDKPRFIAGLQRLSMQSRQFRFLAGVRVFSDEQLRFLTEVDQDGHVCWVAINPTDSAGIGVARFNRIGDSPRSAEWALTVIDEYQHQGIGRRLLAVLVATARARGIRRFVAEVAPDNTLMRDWLARLGAEAVDDETFLLPLRHLKLAR